MFRTSVMLSRIATENCFPFKKKAEENVHLEADVLGQCFGMSWKSLLWPMCPSICCLFCELCHLIYYDSVISISETDYPGKD